MKKGTVVDGFYNVGADIFYDPLLHSFCVCHSVFVCFSLYILRFIWTMTVLFGLFSVLKCRQKTRDFAASCKNSNNGKPCPIKFCQKCLMNRLSS